MGGITISLTGTESTGKSTLAEKLAAYYKATLIPDYSRIYIEQLNRPYVYDDVLQIAQGIIAQEDSAKKNGNPLIISDNDLINIKIWLQYYHWEVPAWLQKAIIDRKYDLYLLCYIDLPWAADPQRANPHDREELFTLFLNELDDIKANYKLIKGIEDKRVENSIKHVDILLKK